MANNVVAVGNNVPGGLGENEVVCDLTPPGVDEGEVEDGLDDDAIPAAGKRERQRTPRHQQMPPEKTMRVVHTVQTDSWKNVPASMSPTLAKTRHGQKAQRKMDCPGCNG